jgi:hypothetical protein
MAFYFIIFTILAIFSALEVYGLKHEVTKKFFYLLSFCLFVLSFIRWETGTDWESYINFFNRSYEWGRDDDFEWGYARINELVKIFFDNYTVFLFVLGAILFYFQSRSILLFSPYPTTSLLFLWCVIFGNVFFVRQSVATVILFYSIRYIQARNLYKFLLLVGLATLFHLTSLIFILAWFVYHLKIRTYIMILFIAISLSLTVFLTKLMSTIGDSAGPIVQMKLAVYLDSAGETLGMETTSLTQIIIKGFANKIFTFGLMLLFLKRIESKGIEFRGYLNLYWVSILIYFSTISISIVFVRLSLVFDMASILLIPIMLNNIERLYMRFFYFFIFLCYLLLRLYLSIVGSYYNSYVPFKTIFGH